MIHIQWLCGAWGIHATRASNARGIAQKLEVATIPADRATERLHDHKLAPLEFLGRGHVASIDEILNERGEIAAGILGNQHDLLWAKPPHRPKQVEQMRFCHTWLIHAHDGAILQKDTQAFRARAHRKDARLASQRQHLERGRQGQRFEVAIEDATLRVDLIVTVHRRLPEYHTHMLRTNPRIMRWADPRASLHRARLGRCILNAVATHSTSWITFRLRSVLWRGVCAISFTIRVEVWTIVSHAPIASSGARHAARTGEARRCSRSYSRLARSRRFAASAVRAAAAHLRLAQRLACGVRAVHR